ncbi:MAG: HAD family phosphatase [Gemmatimonadales bacterium]|nr:HAD family phosphatase [Gemmatimonadales bacterium]
MPALLLDFNGVIINDEEQHRVALTSALESYGIPLTTAEYYRNYLGFDDRECFRHAFRTAGVELDRDRLVEAIGRKGAAYEAAIAEQLDLVPGATAFIEAASREGLAIAIVSAARRSEIEYVLNSAGVLDLVDAIVAAEDVTSCKPSPEGYLYGLDLLRADPADAVAVEDSIPGMQAARAAGLRVAMLATSHPREELAMADLVWDDFAGHHPSELPWR